MKVTISSVIVAAALLSVGVSAQPRGTMDRTSGWMDGGTGGGEALWLVIGVLVVILLAVVITKLVAKKT